MKSSVDDYRIDKPILDRLDWKTQLGIAGSIAGIAALVLYLVSGTFWYVVIAIAITLVSPAVFNRLAHSWRVFGATHRKLRSYDDLYSSYLELTERYDRTKAALRFCSNGELSLKLSLVQRDYRGKVFVHFHAVADLPVRIGQSIVVIDQAISEPIGEFEITRIDANAYVAVECAPVNALWGGHIMSSSSPEMLPPPYSIGLIDIKDGIVHD